MKFIALLGAFLLHQTLACEDCGCDVSCKSDEVLEKPGHRTQDFDVVDQHFEVKDFKVKDFDRKPDRFGDKDRREDNEERAAKNKGLLQDWKHEAHEYSEGRLDGARDYAHASEEEIRALKIKKTDLPVIKTEIRRPIYYRPQDPKIKKPVAPEREEKARPYKFDEPVCGRLPCKFVKPPHCD